VTANWQKKKKKQNLVYKKFDLQPLRLIRLELEGGTTVCTTTSATISSEFCKEANWCALPVRKTNNKQHK